MTTSTALRSNFSDLLAPGLKGVVALSYRERPEEFSKIFKMETSDKQYEKYAQVEGLGIAPLKSESVAVTYADLTQGYSKTMTHLTYGLGFRVSREMYDDDLYDVMKKAATYLGRSIRQRKEVTAANIFNNGFSSSYLGGDGKALFATDHPFKRGGTGSNTFTNQADLSQTTLETAITNITTTTDSDGTNIVLIPKSLIVPPALKFTADVILSSQLKSGTGNNDINPLKNEGISVVVNHYLTDSDAWFILCDQHELKGLNRQMAKFENDDEFDSGDAKFKVTERYSFGWADWKGVYGVSGN